MMVDRQPPASVAIPPVLIQPQHHHQPQPSQHQPQNQHHDESAVANNNNNNNNTTKTLIRSQSVETLEEEEKDILHHLQDLDLLSLPGGAGAGSVAPPPPAAALDDPSPMSQQTAAAVAAATAAQQPLGNNTVALQNDTVGASGSVGATAAIMHHPHLHDDADAHSAVHQVADLNNLQVPDSPCSSTDWKFLNTSNAVHMHIQENAKLPIFNLPVNRKGSTDNQHRHYYYQNHHNHHHHYAPNMSSTGSINSAGGTSAGAAAGTGGSTCSPHNNYRMRRGEEIQPHHTTDMSRLSEMFLKPQHRFGYHASYAQAGALSHDTRTAMPPQHHTGRQHHNNNNNNTMVGMEITLDPSSSSSSPPNYSGWQDSQQQQQSQKPSPTANAAAPVDPLDALAALVDPTPLSEIRRRHEYHHHHSPKPSSPPAAAAGTGATTSGPAPNTSPNTFPPITTANLYYRSFRQNPLPIPTKNVSPPKSPETPSKVPSPLSHEQRPHRGQQITVQQQQQQTVVPPTAPPIAAATPVSTTDNNSVMADAVATAAAIASQAVAAAAAAAAPTTTMNSNNNNNNVATTSTVAAAGTSTTRKAPPPQLQQQQPQQSTAQPKQPPPPVNQQSSSRQQRQSPTKHSQQQQSRHLHPRPEYTPAAIRHASQQRSHYGFGTNHVVPSVPAPPGSKNKRKRQMQQQQQQQLLSKSAASASLASRQGVAPNIQMRANPMPPSAPVAAASTTTTAPSVASTAATTSTTASITRPSVTFKNVSSPVSSARPVVRATQAPLLPQPSNGKNSGARPTAAAASGAAASASAAEAAAAKDGHLNQGAAYERKKQRAKDARVKLNESIERLSVAISMAGTQSQERLDQWNEFQFPIPSNAAMAAQQEQRRQAGSDIMKDCVETAETAKKWDRPSFVGSAAEIIQGLNSQCETLMRSLVALQRSTSSASAGEGQPNGNQSSAAAAAAPTVASVAAAPVASVSSPSSSTTSPSATDAHSGEKRASPIAAEDGTAAKRPRTSNGVHEQSSTTNLAFSYQPWITMDQAAPPTEESTTALSTDTESIFGQWRVLNRIASFLDPISLNRCRSVSKGWHDSSVFSSEVIWQDLAAVRFGYFNVRQWRAKLEDEEEGVVAPSMTLYRSMDRANVMPNFQHDGMFLLGEARLPNKVSAWTFLVERSNGETLRSVRRDPEMSGSGIYTSLPVVELRIVIQNTGCQDNVIIREQTLTVDASTRRRGEQFKEIVWDDRFKKRVLKLDGSPHVIPESPTNLDRQPQLCRLRLFESVVLDTFIHARGCSTNSKFVQRANFTKVLVGLNSGVTVPLVVPFPRDAAHLQH